MEQRRFKAGDTVRCVGLYEPSLMVGTEYQINGVLRRPYLPELVRLLGFGNVYFSGDLFNLVSRLDVGGDAEIEDWTIEPEPLPTKTDVIAPVIGQQAEPFPYDPTPEELEEVKRKELREYKKGMRDWLYGTTSESNGGE